MSTEAMAVVIGVAVGVTASVPTSLLLVALLRRERATPHSELSQHRAPAYLAPQAPQVLLLTPEMLGLHSGSARTPQPPPVEIAADAGLRHLRVIGDDDGW